MSAIYGDTPEFAIWELAEIGDAVFLQKPGCTPHRGVVENRTADGDIVWVISAGARLLFHLEDGYSLRVRAKSRPRAR